MTLPVGEKKRRNGERERERKRVETRERQDISSKRIIS